MLLKDWLEANGYDVTEDLLDLLEDIKDGYADLANYEVNPIVYNKEEIDFLRVDIEDWEKRIAEIQSAFLKEHKNADWEKEINFLMK